MIYLQQMPNPAAQVPIEDPPAESHSELYCSSLNNFQEKNTSKTFFYKIFKQHEKVEKKCFFNKKMLD